MVPLSAPVFNSLFILTLLCARVILFSVQSLAVYGFFCLPHTCTHTHTQTDRYLFGNSVDKRCQVLNLLKCLMF